MIVDDVIREFSGGVLTALPPDKLPPNVLFRAYNTALHPMPGGNTVVKPRPGYVQKLDITGANNQNIIAINQYQYETGGSITRYLMSISANGKLWNSTTEITVPHGGGTLGSSEPWTFETAGNVLYGVGTSKRFKLYHGSGGALTCADIGVARPVAPAGATGAGVMTGDYDFACTWYNQYTGHETSLGAYTTYEGGSALSSHKVTLTKPVGQPTEATHWRVYIRKQTIGIEFWQVADLAATGGGAVASYEVNLTDAQINALTTIAPDTVQNDPPPANLRDLCWHQSRMFYTDGTQVYYSQPGYPEAVDPDAVELVNKRDGQRIVALRALNENALAILKERSIYALIGDSPQNWEIRRISGSVGATSKFIAEGEGITGFWGPDGPYVWDGEGEPANIANEVIREVIEHGQLNPGSLDAYRTVYDRAEKRFLFSIGAVSLYGSAARWTVFPWSAYHKAWESSGWDWPAHYCIASGWDKGTGVFDLDGWVTYFGMPDGRIKLSSAIFRDDEADAQTRLVHVATASSTTSISFVSTLAPTRSTTAQTPRAWVINKDTMDVYPIPSYTLGNVGTTYTISGADVDFPVAPPVGSIIVLDAPVTEIWTHRSQNSLAKHTYQHAVADVAGKEKHRYFVGFQKDQQTTPSRVWHAEEVTDLPATFSLMAFQPDPAGYPTGFLEAADPLNTTTTERFFEKRIAKSGYQHQLRMVMYWPGCRWFLKLLGCTHTQRGDGY